MRKIDRSKIPFLKNRAAKLLDRRSEYKDYRRRKNESLNNKKEPKPEKDYKHINAPERLSLIENYEETLKFIKEIEICFEKKKSVFIVLKNVKYLANESIVVLLSILIKFKSKGIAFNGDFPNDKKANSVLEKSGFLKYLKYLIGSKQVKEEKEYSIGKHTILTRANKKVDSELSNKMIAQATKYIWKEERRCPGVQRVLIELMQNTNNHASTEKGDNHWWITMNYNEEENKVCFAFIDYGVGIFKSLLNKKEGDKSYSFLEAIKKMFSNQKNYELLERLLKGEIHKTATGNYFRGKGLPGIFNAFEKEKISNLIVISNDAIADCQGKKYMQLENELSGTFVYWELESENQNIANIA